VSVKRGSAYKQYCQNVFAMTMLRTEPTNERMTMRHVRINTNALDAIEIWFNYDVTSRHERLTTSDSEIRHLGGCDDAYNLCWILNPFWVDQSLKKRRDEIFDNTLFMQCRLPRVLLQAQLVLL
jgi:hypothetical protein